VTQSTALGRGWAHRAGDEGRWRCQWRWVWRGDGRGSMVPQMHKDSWEAEAGSAGGVAWDRGPKRQRGEHCGGVGRTVHHGLR
jgi:hypothetical protein